MQMIWLVVAIVATVAYHVVMKLTPAQVSPFLTLTVTYAVVTVSFAAIYFALPSSMPLRTALAEVNWTAPVLAAVIVLLDLGFLMLYRGGFEVSLGQIITQSAGALLLVLVGVAFFAEKLSLANAAGILLCVAGLWLVNQR